MGVVGAAASASAIAIEGSSSSAKAMREAREVRSSVDAITITYGDQAENHVGMQIIGRVARRLLLVGGAAIVGLVTLIAAR